MSKQAELYQEVAAVINFQPIGDVIPVLVTASARCLVVYAKGDMVQLEKDYTRFCEHLQDQMQKAINEDMAEAREATKQ